MMLLAMVFLLSCGGGNQNEADEGNFDETGTAISEDTIANDGTAMGADTMGTDNARVWRLISYGQPANLTNVPSGMEVTLMMDMQQNRISGRAACGDYTGTLSSSGAGGGMDISQVSASGTQQNCNDNRAKQMQSDYLDMLRNVADYQIENNQLIMTLEDGRQMIFNS